MSFTSITDRPVASKSEELLDVGRYIHALSSFIRDADTPLTVGIQGEWGSGKTSMMNMICENMEEVNIATAWVNTWEYSMFKEPSQIAPDCMGGLLENLKLECERKGYWPKSLSDKVNHVGGFLKNVGKFALDVGVKQLTGTAGFSKAVADGNDKKELRAEIAQIKQHIQDIVKLLIDDPSNPFKMVVFFVDDLDRIDPSIAVNVLEALKNLFDIPNAVFVLAIDYEVVVKGLESKFGKKTEQNEREFRSFFDKIIQVPFSMPLASYNIERLIKVRLASLGMSFPENESALYSSMVANTAGSNPRSIKRYINTFSLLSRLNEVDDIDNVELDNISKFALFGMVGIQLAYPKIYQLIMRDSNFLQWDERFAEICLVDLSVFPEEMKSEELYDEIWEQIIWCVCQREIFLKSRSASVLTAMNLIRTSTTDDGLVLVLERVMALTNITAVDDDIEVKQIKHKKIRYEGWEEYCQSLLEKGFSSNAIELITYVKKEIDDRCRLKGISLIMNYAPSEFGFSLDVPLKRKTKFVAIFPRKKGFSFWSPSGGQKTHKVSTTTDMNESFWEILDESILEILDRVK